MKLCTSALIVFLLFAPSAFARGQCTVYRVGSIQIHDVEDLSHLMESNDLKVPGRESEVSEVAECAMRAALQKEQIGKSIRVRVPYSQKIKWMTVERVEFKDLEVVELGDSASKTFIVMGSIEKKSPYSQFAGNCSVTFRGRTATFSNRYTTSYADILPILPSTGLYSCAKSALGKASFIGTRKAIEQEDELSFEMEVDSITFENTDVNGFRITGQVTASGS